MARRLELILISLSILLCCSAGFGQWQVFTEEDGLPSDSVHAITVDIDRDVWFGTRRGVARLTGPEMWAYEMEPTYMSSIADAASDWGGRTWFTGPYGLMWFDRGSSTPVFLPPHLMYAGPAFCLAVRGDCLWAGCIVGVYRFSGDDPLDASQWCSWEDHAVFSTEASYTPTDFAVDSEGVVWMSGWPHPMRLDSDGWHRVEGFLSRFTRCVEVDADDLVWFGGDSCVLRYDRTEWWARWDLTPGAYVRPGPAGYVYDIEIEPGGEMWFGGQDGAVFYDFENTVYYGSPPLPDLSVRQITVESPAKVWFSTSAGAALLTRDVPTLPMFLGIDTNRPEYAIDDNMQVSMDLIHEGEAQTADFYVALEVPSGELLFYPSFGTKMAPFLPGAQIPADLNIEDYELFTLTLPDLPAGTYRWHAAFTHAGTMEYASTIASCEWEFTK